MTTWLPFQAHLGHQATRALVQLWEVAAVGTLTRNLHPPSLENPEEQSCETRVQQLCKAPPAEQC